MPTLQIRPDETFGDERPDWLTSPRLLIHGGRIERRRTRPLAGWWIIVEGRAIGPFPGAREAQRWAQGA